VKRANYSSAGETQVIENILHNLLFSFCCCKEAQRREGECGGTAIHRNAMSWEGRQFTCI